MSAAFDPERAFVGAVLQIDAGRAREAVEQVPGTDLADPRLTVVLEAAATLARVGICPDPVSVFSRLRADGTVTGTDALRSLAELLHDVVSGCPVPASVTWYAAAVLEEAVRRRAQEASTRIGQASSGGPLATLVELVDTERAAVAQLWERRCRLTERVLTS